MQPYTSPYPPKSRKPANGTAQASGGGLLKDQLQLLQSRDEHGQPKYEIKPIQSTLSFDKGFYVVIRALQMLTSHMDDNKTIVVGVAGPSGSGKTSLVDKIHQLMPGTAVLHVDNYNVPDRLIDGNFDDPRLTDYDLLLENIRGLKEGRTVDTPVYDFKTSCRVGYKPVHVPVNRIVIVEGIYALSERLRPLLDLRVSITGGVHFDLIKRVLRDVNRSGQAPEEIIQQIAETVFPMYKTFGEPDLATAHIKISNNFNPFTGFMEPTFILKSDRPVSEEQVMRVFDEVHAEELGGGGGASGGAGIASITSTPSLLPPPNSLASRTSSGRQLNPSPTRTAERTERSSQHDGTDPPADATPSSMGSPASRASLSAPPVTRDCNETFDIYLLPPHEDPETCNSWLRMRNREGRYSLMFEENITDGPFIVSPRISFEVSVRLLGGLMALGYQIGTIIRRQTVLLTDGRLSIKLDEIGGMQPRYVQIQGKDRDRVAWAGKRLGLEGSYIPKTYIEQIQLDKLTSAFQQMPEGLLNKLIVDGTPVLEEGILGTTPPISSSYLRANGFKSIMGFPSPSKPASEGGRAVAVSAGTEETVPTSSSVSRPLAIPSSSLSKATVSDKSVSIKSASPAPPPPAIDAPRPLLKRELFSNAPSLSSTMPSPRGGGGLSQELLQRHPSSPPSLRDVEQRLAQLADRLDVLLLSTSPSQDASSLGKASVTAPPSLALHELRREYDALRKELTKSWAEQAERQESLVKSMRHITMFAALMTCGLVGWSVWRK